MCWLCVCVYYPFPCAFVCKCCVYLPKVIFSLVFIWKEIMEILWACEPCCHTWTVIFNILELWVRHCSSVWYVFAQILITKFNTFLHSQILRIMYQIYIRNDQSTMCCILSLMFISIYFSSNLRHLWTFLYIYIYVSMSYWSTENIFRLL